MEDDKVRVTLRIGESLIEIEGSEHYVDKKLEESDSFDNLIQKITGIAQPVLPKQKAKVKTTIGAKGKPKKVGKGVGYEMIKDLVLSGEGDKTSLKEFYSQKVPKSNYERNLVFCYYLLKIRGIGSITINHIYTCYKEVKQRIPSLSVSLSETSQKGWLDTSNMSDIKVTPRGEDYVELDLPKADKAR